MIHIPEKIDYLQHLSEGAIIFDGLEECIHGVDHMSRPIYDYVLMMNKFIEDGMTEDEAIEWIDYNVIQVNAGEGFVIHYY